MQPLEGRGPAGQKRWLPALACLVAALAVAVDESDLDGRVRYVECLVGDGLVDEPGDGLLGARMRVLGSEAAFVVLGVDQQATDPKTPQLDTVQTGGAHPRHRGGARRPAARGHPDFDREAERAIRSEGTPPVTLSEAAAVLDVIESAIHSSRTGTVFAFSP
ncbi:hypothetical protein [Streptomyces sp. NPDC005485]|uniref:hypothetical protein n=1 Tax=Streptomyces sp. NPDC005485 TaxID=3155591 RepID=UPI0033A21DBC